MAHNTRHYQTWHLWMFSTYRANHLNLCLFEFNRSRDFILSLRLVFEYISLEHRLFKRSERSVIHILRPFLRRGCQGTSFTVFYRTSLFHTIYRLGISSVGGNDSHNPFSVIFYFIIHYHHPP